ncbi:conserved hypothetical protein [Gloeothece citriformis PCC 7424]|uniref:DUF4336 domain-containing protein n=1 Tax=Gloeothece citriformis (strain PCC 7424) TaxID=65393 RepID=B7KIW9_GLOC7|nr:DUF4336 domain-containing protein [Gloeothece citriformis]ACK70805.1 conserved hypothetical protein [Gloeothece citriformis PCC 7424]
MQGQQIQQNIRPQDFSWPFWPIVPLYPYGKRRTIRQEVIKDKLWTFDQIQGILYVIVPIRMSVVKLIGGGLLIYAPVAPTPECIQLVRELEEQHGEVKYIILPTVSGIEHKVFVGPFARYFKKAQVYVAPSQWSFPLNLPLSWLGFPGNRTHILPFDSRQTPFADQFDYAILNTIELGLGRFQEVAFFDKYSQTLLVTDSVVSVPKNPPAIVQLYPYSLLFHAKEDAFDVVVDNEANRRKGWQKICLFALYIRPSTLESLGLLETLANAFKAPDRSKQAYFGLFPFRWQYNWQQSFDALQTDNPLLVAPILQTLIFNRAPQDTFNWVEKVASWDFKRIVSCHLDSPIEANFSQFRQAFNFLTQNPSLTPQNQSLPQTDFQFLRAVDRNLSKFRIVPPPQS